MAGAWFAAFVALHWLVNHCLAPSRRAAVLVVGYGVCCIGLIITLTFFAATPLGRLLGGMFAMLTIGALFVLYVPIYYVVANSLSVQSIVLLYQHHGRLPRAELYERFAGRRLLQGRLETLVRSGYAVSDGTVFRITERGSRLITPFVALKRLWRLGPGG